MNWLFTIPLRLRSLFRKGRVEDELGEELRFHMEHKIAELRDRGLSAAQARAAAERDFGNRVLLAEQCRDQRGWNGLEALVQDLRFSVRGIFRTPAFAAISIASLALGIGSSSAIFSILDVAVLHPLPVRDSGRLVWFREYGKDHQESGGNPARLRDWQRARSFSASTGVYSEGSVFSDRATRVRLEGVRYIGALPQVLGAALQLGRFPSPDELRDGASVLVLTDSAWRKYLRADPGVLHRSLNLSGKLYQVIGVLNRGVRYPEATDFWAPAPREIQNATREAGFLAQAARLAPGVSLAQAQAEIDTLTAQLARDHAPTDAGRALRLQLLTNHLSTTARKPLLLFFAATLGILLIACVNVAGLLLARGLNRQRETSVRAALGAGRSRLLRLFLTESFLLAFAGCLAGILLAMTGIDVLRAALPEETPRLAEATINLRVLLFAASLAFASTLLCGLLPAWKAAGRAVAVGLKEGGRGSVGGVHTHLRSLLVVAQIALSLTLLIVGGLLVSSFVHMRQAPLGFEPQQAYSFTVPYPWDTPGSVIDTTAAQVIDRLSAAPGVQAAGVVDRLPLHGGSQSRVLVVEGLDLPPGEREQQMGWRMSSAGFFPAAGIPLIAGALFQPFQDHGPRECLISRQLAATVFAGVSPIGRRIASRPRPSGAPQWFRIVGVIGDTRLHSTDAIPASEIYIPWGADGWPILNFVVRTNRPLSELSSLVHQRIDPLLGAQVIENLATLDQLTADTRTDSRTRALLAAALAGVALLLSAIGLFALLAHETVRRTPEYGIRLALGANPVTLATGAFSRALRLTVPGLVFGMLAAFLLTRTLKSLLFEVRGADPLTYIVSTLLLLAVALIASLAPAVRVARIDPLTALRHE